MIPHEILNQLIPNVSTLTLRDGRSATFVELFRSEHGTRLLYKVGTGRGHQFTVNDHGFWFRRGDQHHANDVIAVNCNHVNQESAEVATLTQELANAKQECQRLTMERTGFNVQVDGLQVAITQLQNDRRSLIAQRDGWERTAAQHLKDYNDRTNVLTLIGELFGEEAFRCDDGSMSENVLLAKVPELVKKLVDSHIQLGDPPRIRDNDQVLVFDMKLAKFKLLGLNQKEEGSSVHLCAKPFEVQGTPVTCSRSAGHTGRCGCAWPPA